MELKKAVSNLIVTLLLSLLLAGVMPGIFSVLFCIIAFIAFLGLIMAAVAYMVKG